MNLFSVIHQNGEEWTKDEVEDYLIENDSYLFNFYVFSVDTYGDLYALDKCGQAEELNPDDFKVVWNIETFIELNKNEEDQ